MSPIWKPPVEVSTTTGDQYCACGCGYLVGSSRFWTLPNGRPAEGPYRIEHFPPPSPTQGHNER